MSADLWTPEQELVNLARRQRPAATDAELLLIDSMRELLAPGPYRHVFGTARLGVQAHADAEVVAATYVELWTFTGGGSSMVYMAPDDVSAFCKEAQRWASKARSGVVAVSPAGSMRTSEGAPGS